MSTQYAVELLFGIPGAKGSLDALERDLAGVDKAIKGTEATTKRLDRELEGLGRGDPFKPIERGARGAEGAVSKLWLALGKIAAVLAVAQGVKFVFANAAELESQTRSLQTLTGSAEKARDIVKELQQYANVTPFESKEVIDTAKRLSAFGVEADRIVTVTKRLGDIAGATGADLDGLALAYGQVVAKGRLQGEELLQFQERGVGLQTELQKMYGLTGEELQKALEKGRISSQALEVAIERLTAAGGKYANGAIAQSDTLTGKLSTLQDAVAGLARTIGALLTPAFKGALDTATDLVNKIQQMIDQTRNQAQEQGFRAEAEQFVNKNFPGVFNQGQRAEMFQRRLDQSRADYALTQQKPVAPGATAATAPSAVPALLAGTSAGGKPKLSSKGHALVAAARKLGVDPLDLALLVEAESGGNANIWGGAGGSYYGLIQFGAPERSQYGVRQGSSFEEQIQGPVPRYLKDRFAGAGRSTQGAGLLDLYTAVLAGNPNANPDARDSFGNSARSQVAKLQSQRGRVRQKYFGGADPGYDRGGALAQGYDAEESLRQKEADRQARLKGLESDVTFGKQALELEKQLNAAKQAGNEIGAQLAENALTRLGYEKQSADIVRETSDPEERKLKLQELGLKQQQSAIEAATALAAVEQAALEKSNALLVEKARLQESALRPVQDEIDALTAQLNGTEKLLAAKRELAGLTNAGLGEGQAKALLGQRDALKAQTEAPGFRLKKALESSQEALKQLTDPVAQITAAADSISGAFGDAFGNIVSGSQTAGEALSGMFKRIGQSFIDMAAQIATEWLKMKLIGGLGGLLGGGGGGGGPVGGFLTGGLFNSGIGSGFGLAGFAEGGYVSGPTPAVVGEGGESEYIIPSSKMAGAMSRYSQGARGKAVVQGGAGPSGHPAKTATATEGTIRLETTVINGVEYATVRQVEIAARQAAKQGAAGGYAKVNAGMVNSRSTRQRWGVTR